MPYPEISPQQSGAGPSAGGGSLVNLPLFRFIQIEVPFPLGPPDGRYLVRRGGAGPGSEPSHVLVMATLAAPRRHLLERAGRGRRSPSQPPPTPVDTGRATIIAVSDPLSDDRSEEARAWLRSAGRRELDQGLEVLRQALRAYRAVSARPEVADVDDAQLLIARVGFGAGEEVADGRWAEARELPLGSWRREREGGRRDRRRRAIEPQARLADALRGRVPVLLCEELTLRARRDLDHGDLREAALQLAIALDAALAELPRAAAALAAEPGSPTDLRPRLDELSDARALVADVTARALAGEPTVTDGELVAHTLGRLEAALRARLVAAQTS